MDCRLPTKIKPLTDIEWFSYSDSAKMAFETQKEVLGHVTLLAIDEDQNFAEEADTSSV